jgi:hypothetical protein
MRRLHAALRLAVLSLILAQGALAAAPADDPATRAQAFLRQVGGGSVNAAYDSLFAGSPIAVDKVQEVDAIKRQTAAMLPIYGPVLGVEPIGQTQFGTSVMRLTYIMKCQKHPIIWTFIFYRPVDRWITASVLFNDEFRGLPDK